jgi:hypothetical protein
LTNSGIQSGQTGYLSFGAQFDVVVLHTPGGGAFHTNDIYYGLEVYLMDNVNNTAGNTALTAAQALGISNRILARVAAGAALTLADCNVAIRAQGGVAAGSTLDGAGATWSTGSVLGVLRILSGEAYQVPANSVVIGAAGIFPGGAAHVPCGAFLTRGVTGYRAVRRFYNTGALARSVLVGILSRLTSDVLFSWLNPEFTYGAAGTALAYGGAQIGAAGTARAVTVYAVDGSVV